MPSTCLLVALLVLALVRWDRLVAERRGRPGRPGGRAAGRPGDRAGRRAVRGGAGQPRPDGPADPGRRAVRPRGGPGVLRRPAPGRSPRWRPASAWRRCCTSSCRCGRARSRRRWSTGTPRPGAASGRSCWPASSRATSGALADLPARRCGLARFAGSQLGVLAWLVPPAFVVTALRFPRYALLSGVAARVTCLFAASTSTPTSAATTWARRCSPGPGSRIAAGTLVEASSSWTAPRGSRPGRADGEGRDRTPATPRQPVDRPSGTGRLAVRTSVALALALALLVPTAVALPALACRRPLRGHGRRRLAGRCHERPRPGRRRGLVVVVLHAALVRHARRGPAPGPAGRGRQRHREREPGRASRT